MENPESGLKSLLKCLKPNDLSKSAVQQEARKLILEARKFVEDNMLYNDIRGIRKFRKAIYASTSSNLSKLPEYSTDFFSTSECRDLACMCKNIALQLKIQNLLELNNLKFAVLWLTK